MGRIRERAVNSTALIFYRQKFTSNVLRAVPDVACAVPMTLLRLSPVVLQARGVPKQGADAIVALPVSTHVTGSFEVEILTSSPTPSAVNPLYTI